MNVYSITNNINGKKYVGMTSNIKSRIADHRWEGNNSRSEQLIHKAMRKYGRDNFTFEILERTGNRKREEYWMRELNTLSPNGYNKVYVSRYKEQNSFYGKKHSTKTIEKLVENQTGKRIPSKHLPVTAYKEEKKVKTFEAKIDAYKWLYETRQTVNKSSRSVTTQINDSIKRKTKAFGYTWSEKV